MTGGGPAGRRRPPVTAVALGLATVLSAGAQEAPPATEVVAAPALDPFEGEAPIQAERLRGLRPEIVATILAGRPGGEIALAALACPAPHTRGGVAVFLEIDGASFLDANQASLAPVEVYAYALTAGGAVAGYLAEAFVLDVARYGEQIWNGGIRFVGWLTLPPGSYRLQILVHNARSLASGLAATRLVVPASGPGAAGGPLAAGLPPPLLPGPRRRRPWLSVRGRGGWPPAGRPGYPFAVGNRPLLPAARPVLVGGRTGEAHLFAERLPAGARSATIELLASGSPAEAALVAAAPAEIRRETPASGRPAALHFSFATPAAPAGRYDLRLRIESDGGPLTSAPLGVLVVDAGPQDRELLWSDLRGIASAPPEPAAAAATGPGEAPPPASRGASRRGSRRVAARYRRALAAAAADDRPAALLDFEVAVLGAGGEAPLLRLRAAELTAAAALGRERPELLLALVSLHDELFHLYRRRHLFSLVAHSRRLLEELGELYAELGGEPETAATILASVGGYMQRMRAPGDSRRLFERALAHEPDSPAALLGLAASYEKYGEYGRAARQLERLAAVRPDLEEARLRLALNLERVGDRQRSRELLDAIAAEGGGWVRAIACQELARSLLRAGSTEQAAVVLERALDEMPERQALRVLLAHVEDRLGLLDRARESLRRVAARPAGERSERLIYDDWANGPLERARESLARRAGDQRAGLVAALEAGKRQP